MKLTDFQKGLSIVLIAFFLLGGIIFATRVMMGDSFSKEEAQHALYGVWLAKDIRALDWGGFWYDTHRQMFWPFFHSWVLSIFFFIFGVGYLQARLLSFLLFFGMLILMYDVSFRLCSKSGWKIGLISVFLALSSPLAIRYATENTLEGLGAMIFLATFYLYTRCEQRKLTIDYVFLGLLMGLSIYTNYLYAYLMIPSFIVMTIGKVGPIFAQAVHLEHEGEKAALPFVWWAYRKLIVLAVLSTLIVSWFFTAAFSRKIMLLLQAIFRYSGGDMVFGFWPTLFYYPWVIINKFTFSPWLGLIFLVSLFTPFVAFRFAQFGKLYTFVWTVLILATLTIPSKAPQIIYIIAPFIFMLAAAAVVYFMDKYKKHAITAVAVILIPALVSFPQLVGLYFPPQPAEKVVQVLDYFHQSVLPRDPIASAINTQRFPSEVVAFHFWDWNAPVLVDPIIGDEEMFRGGQYFLSLELGTETMFEPTDDSSYRWNSFLAEKVKQGEAKEYSARRFSALGLTAKIYEKTSR
ncbi:MAG: glycosyltransferase family 39 protein [bacterium]